MITGISRFKKGEFNQAAIDEVYNKGKELYKDPVSPPSSGVILNTKESIWDDMTTSAEVSAPATAAEFNKGPIWKNGDYTPPPSGTGIVRNPNDVSKGYNPGPPGAFTTCPDWRKCNVWFEVEEDAGPPVKWCAPSINQAVNSMVEISGLYGYWLDYDGNWHELWKNKKTFAGGRYPRSNMNYVGRGCTEEAWETYNDIRMLYPDYEPKYGFTNDGNSLIRPAHYWRVHMWAEGAIEVPQLWDNTGGKSTPPGQMKGYYTCAWARLVLVDPDGTDDRHIARYIWHVSGDARSSDSTPACDSDIGGISKYKLVPQNGDWEAVNMIVGDLTEAEFMANPPPFPTTP